MSTEKQKDGRTLGCVIWMKNIVRNSTSVHTFPVTCMGGITIIYVLGSNYCFMVMSVCYDVDHLILYRIEW